MFSGHGTAKEKMKDEDYIFTSNGFRKVVNPVPERLRIALMLQKRNMLANTSVGENSPLKSPMKKNRPLETVHKSDSMDKYKMTPGTNRNLKLHSAPPSRNSSALPRNMIYSVRNPDCTPPQMYLHENVRLYAKHNHQQTQSTLRKRRAQSADVAYQFGKPIRLPVPLTDNEHLTNEGLTMGQKQYIWGIARCYSMENLKKLNQRRTRNMLEYEYKKRSITKDMKENTKEKLWKEYTEYKKFIEETSKNGFVRRTKSANYRPRFVGNNAALYEEENYNDSLVSSSNINNNMEQTVPKDETSYDSIIIINSSSNHGNEKFLGIDQMKKIDIGKKPLQRPKSACNFIRRHEATPESSDDEEELTFLTNEKLSLHNNVAMVLRNDQEYK